MESVTAEEFRSVSPELWDNFAAAGSEDEFCQLWLALQSGLVGSVVQSLLIFATAADEFTPVATWPEDGSDPLRLSDVAERVLEEQCGLVVELPDSTDYGVAYPLMMDGQLRAVVALQLAVQSADELHGAMEQLQWGISWLEIFIRRQQADRDQAAVFRLKSAVDLLAQTLSKEHFSEAALCFTTELAALSGCERVSLGFMRGSHVKLEAVSHSTEVGKKMNLTRAIERVMEEALLQRREVVYPALDDEVLICREHEALSRQQAMAAVASFPLFSNENYYAVLTCERAADQPFKTADMEFVRAVAALAGSALENKHRNDQALLRKVLAAGYRQLEFLFGSGYVGRKMALLACVGVFTFFSTATGNYRLSADTALEGAILRAIVVPFDGYIEQSTARAGDTVAKGQVLCSLDSRDLQLTKLAKLSQFHQMERQYQDATANHDRAEAGIIRSQLKQGQAELDLIEAKLQRTQLRAPFTGLLVSGDLSQRLGGAVSQGEVLFEVAPLDAYRVILKVDERRIDDVKHAQSGTLVLSSLPDQQYPFVVDKITPITRAEEGRNYFRVEAYLSDVDDRLRPGMEGVGKIFIDRRKLISIWTRDLIEWLQLTLWKWLP